MASITNIPITSSTIIKCYQKFYPNTYDLLERRMFHFLNLWTIRVKEYGFPKMNRNSPDSTDYTGGLRINNFGFSEITTARCESEPFTGMGIAQKLDATRNKLGGIPYIKAGQYVYEKKQVTKLINGEEVLIETPTEFIPIQPLNIQRWKISDDDNKKLFLLEQTTRQTYEEALNSGRIRNSKSFLGDISDNREELSILFGSNEKLSYQEIQLNRNLGNIYIPDWKVVNTLGEWANAHINKAYLNIFTYTIFTRQQFLEANSDVIPKDKNSAIKYILMTRNFAKDRPRFENMDDEFLILWATSIYEGYSNFIYKNQSYRNTDGRRR